MALVSREPRLTDKVSEVQVLIGDYEWGNLQRGINYQAFMIDQVGKLHC